MNEKKTYFIVHKGKKKKNSNKIIKVNRIVFLPVENIRLFFLESLLVKFTIFPHISRSLFLCFFGKVQLDLNFLLTEQGLSADSMSPKGRAAFKASND